MYKRNIERNHPKLKYSPNKKNRAIKNIENTEILTISTHIHTLKSNNIRLLYE